MSNLDHRKATKTIKVTDINGMPVKNAKLRLLQKSHEFLSDAAVLISLRSPMFRMKR